MSHSAGRYLPVLALAATCALAFFGLASASPQINEPSLDEGFAAATEYRLKCWQSGVKIVDEPGTEPLTALEILDTTQMKISHTDGSRRIVFTTGESLCIIELEPNRAPAH